MKASNTTAATQKMLSVLLSASPLQEMSNAHVGNGLAMLLWWIAQRNNDVLHNKK